jgi:hypothetical protein
VKRLPLHHRHRIRRKLRRAMFRFHPVDPTHRALEEWTGHQQPPDPMKTLRAIAIAALLIACVLWTLVSCSPAQP